MGIKTPHVILLLGNPGDRYSDTRHNLGWWVGDILAETARIRFRPGNGDFHAAEGRVAGKPALLVKPQTFMNESGRAIDDLARSVDVAPERLLVVADDIALPLGQMRIRSGGSSGGHNGLGSVIEHVGSEQFTRVRVGIGPVPDEVDASEFVLDGFGSEELIAARGMAARAAEAVAMILARGVGAAANVYNRKPPAPDGLANESMGAQ